MLVNLNHTQSLLIILVNDCLDTCGFTGTTVAKQQTVIRFLSKHKRLCIIYKLFLLDLITNQIIQHYLICIRDWDKFQFLTLIMADTKCLVQTKHANTILLVKSGHDSKDLIDTFRLADTVADITHLLTDILVIHLFLLRQ